jgi:hypothetical protein
MVARHDKIGSSGNGTFENPVVVRIGRDRFQSEFGRYESRGPYHKLQLRDDLGLRPLEDGSKHVSDFTDDGG